MNEELNFKAFKAICNFVENLSDVFGSKFKSIKLYNRLTSKTEIVNDVAINKHLNIFKDFCIANQDAILSQNKLKFQQTKLSYSTKVYIDISNVLSLSDNETSKVIFQHLLTITALLVPTTDAKTVLEKVNTESDESKDLIVCENETDELVLDIISFLENNIGHTTNPLEAIMKLVSSGSLMTLIAKVKNAFASGKDLGKIIASIQKVLKSGKSEFVKGDDVVGALNSFQSFLPMLGGLMGNSGKNFDMSAITNVISQLSQEQTVQVDTNKGLQVDTNKGLETKGNDVDVSKLLTMFSTMVQSQKDDTTDSNDTTDEKHAN